MSLKIAKRNEKRIKRAHRVRKHVRGTTERPRLSVYKTNSHISAQVIDDATMATLVSFSTQKKELKGTPQGKKSKENAFLIGEKLAQMAKEKGIEKVVFDRGHYKYHGLVAELARGARSAGLIF